MFKLESGLERVGDGSSVGLTCGPSSFRMASVATTSVGVTK